MGGRFFLGSTILGILYILTSLSLLFLPVTPPLVLSLFLPVPFVTAAAAGFFLSRKNLALARWRVKKNLEVVLNSIEEGVIITDGDHKALFLNPEASRLTGWSESEAQGRPLLEIYRTLDFHTREPLEDWTRRLSEKSPTSGVLLEGRHGWGARITERGGPWELENGARGWILLFRDVSDFLALQDRLHHAQKMESIGLLTGGVAHDFNNLLSGIMGAAEILKDDLPPDKEMSELVDIILKTCDRATELTQKLLAFSRKGKGPQQEAELTSVVQEAVGILEHTMDKRIEISLTLPGVQYPIQGDPALIQNSILNLGVNARDALPKGGRLEIALAQVTLGESFGKGFYKTAPPGEYVCISVKDNGKGMDEEVRSRLFDPFFTTKPLGEGTGLGLATVLRCMKEHGGALWFQSEYERGTEFRLYFPLRKSPTAPLSPNSPPEDFRGQGRVLLADDETIILATVGEMLSTLGFEVVKAVDGEQAWEELQKSPDYTLALIDLVMPRLDGHALLKKIKKIAPDLPVILMSGYSKTSEPRKLVKEGATAFLQKPFHRQQLADLLSHLPLPHLDRQG